MKRILKQSAVVAAMLAITAAAWAQSNGDSYVPDEKTMISKGVPLCYKALTEWAASQVRGDATAPTPPGWVTANCAVKYEQPVRAFTGSKPDEYWSNN
jgi:hypothetical protein